jgi:hypothetical protein
MTGSDFVRDSLANCNLAHRSIIMAYRPVTSLELRQFTTRKQNQKVKKKFRGGAKGLPALKDDNFTAIYEPII